MQRTANYAILTAMKFIYTHHANLRISQRELSRSQIQNTVVSPDDKITGFKSRWVARKKFGTKTLEVIYKKLNGTVVIITAYRLQEE